MTQRALDALRAEIVDRVYGQDLWLDTLDVAKPVGVDDDTWITQVHVLLADLQLDGVRVRVAPGACGSPWVRELALVPGWG